MVTVDDVDLTCIADRNRDSDLCVEGPALLLEVTEAGVVLAVGASHPLVDNLTEHERYCTEHVILCKSVQQVWNDRTTTRPDGHGALAGSACRSEGTTSESADQNSARGRQRAIGNPLR